MGGGGVQHLSCSMTTDFEKVISQGRCSAVR